MSNVRLLDLLSFLEANDHPAHVWLSQGVEQWRQDGTSLDRALGLAGVNAVEAAKEALYRAALLLDPDQRRPPFEAAKLLEAAITRFKLRKWKAARALGSPDHLESLDRILWEALTNSGNIPSSARRLYDLLTERGWQRQQPASEHRISTTVMGSRK